MGLDIYLYRSSRRALEREEKARAEGDKYTSAIKDEIAYFRKFWALLDRFPEYQYGEDMEIPKEKLIELRNEAFNCIKAICEAFKGEIECSPLGIDPDADVPSPKLPYGEYSKWIQFIPDNFIPDNGKTIKEFHENAFSFENKLRKVIEENYHCETRHPGHHQSMVILNDRKIDYDCPYYNDIALLYHYLDIAIRDTDFDNGEIIILNADW